MQELHFTLRCQGCGASFSRSVQRPPASAELVTLYCSRCGCPHRVEPRDGVLRDRWAADGDQSALTSAGAPAEAVPES